MFEEGDNITLGITCVYLNFENIIEYFEVSVSSMGNYLSKGNGNRYEKQAGITQMLIDEDYNKRDKEKFEMDLACVLEKIK